MKRFALSLVASLMLVAAAAAQDMKQTVTGTVVSVTNDVLVLDTATGQRSFPLDSVIDRMRFDDLKPGARVQVSTKMDGGTEVATDVTTLQEAPRTGYVDADRTGTPYTDPNRATTSTDARMAQNDAYDNQLPSTAGSWVVLGLVSLSVLFAGLGLWAKARQAR
jgi:hypothetical protein